MLTEFSNSEAGREADVLAVVVLYRMAAGESLAYRTLEAVRRERGRGRRVNLLVWDNSEVSEALPEDFDGEFCADTSNPGLAAAYARGLELARERGSRWLMLLDQDTAVTEAYVDEVLGTVAAAGPEVAAVLPRLRHRGATVSPVVPRLLGPARPFRGGVGVAAVPLQAFNSGAVLRLSSMESAGGFDRRFALDYLDHATFAALQRRGGALHVLEAELEHGLSTDTGRAATVAERWRQASTLAAEARFYRVHGTVLERWVHPLRLLRRALSVLLLKRDWASAVQIAGSMLRRGL